MIYNHKFAKRNAEDEAIVNDFDDIVFEDDHGDFDNPLSVASLSRQGDQSGMRMQLT